MLALAYFLALILATASVHKWIERERLVVATAALTGLNERQAPYLLLVAGVSEGLASIAFVLPELVRVGAIGAGILWSIYALALFRRRGFCVDCGCDFDRSAKPVSNAMILRPVALVFIAALTALMPQSSWSADQAFAGLGLAALWFATGELLSLPQNAKAR